MSQKLRRERVMYSIKVEKNTKKSKPLLKEGRINISIGISKVPKYHRHLGSLKA
jgi:hypothetical protein